MFFFVLYGNVFFFYIVENDIVIFIYVDVVWGIFFNNLNCFQFCIMNVEFCYCFINIFNYLNFVVFDIENGVNFFIISLNCI